MKVEVHLSGEEIEVTMREERRLLKKRVVETFSWNVSPLREMHDFLEYAVVAGGGGDAAGGDGAGQHRCQCHQQWIDRQLECC